MKTLNFGVEFEFVGMGSTGRDVGMRLHNEVNIGDLPQLGFAWGGTYPNHWFLKADGSVRRTDNCTDRSRANARCGTCNFCQFPGGIEIVSPILEYNEEGLMQVYRVCEGLKALGAYANETCGYHVHFDARWLQNYPREFANDFLVFMAQSYANDEDIFDEFVANSRKANTNQYCKSLRNLNNYIDIDRYYKLNTKAFARHGTIEFRQHHGTVDHKEALDWIHLCAKYYMDKRAEFLYHAEQNRNYARFTSAIRENFNSFI